MPISDPGGGSGFQIKTFWDRNEGKVGRTLIIAMLAALGVGVALLWAKILPFLIILTAKTGLLVALLVALIIFIRVVLSEKFRIGVWCFFQWLSTMIARFFYPIGDAAIMQAFVRDRQKKQARAEEGTERLRGTIKRFQSKIDRTITAREREVKLTRSGQRQLQGSDLGEEERIRLAYATKLSAVRAGMLKETALSLQQLRDELERYYKIMLRLVEAGKFVVGYYEAQVERILMQREGVNDAHKAMRDIRAIIKGDALSALYDDVVAHVMAEMEQKLGEIDGFYDSAQTFLSKLDLEKGVYEEDTLEELRKLAAKVETTITQMDNSATQGLDLGLDEERPLQQQGGVDPRDSGGIRSIADLLGDDPGKR